MGFEFVVEGLRLGQCFYRRAWSFRAPFPYIFLVPGSTFNKLRSPLKDLLAEGTQVSYLPHIDMMHIDGKVGVWTPSTADIMADDWIMKVD